MATIWTLIRRFSLSLRTSSSSSISSDVRKSTSASGVTSLSRNSFVPISSSQLLGWVKSTVGFYPGVTIDTFENSFWNGLAFCGFIHKFSPELLNFGTLKHHDHSELESIKRMRLAFETAYNKFNIPPLLDPEDVYHKVLDERSIMAYIAEFYHVFDNQMNGIMPVGRASSSSSSSISSTSSSTSSTSTATSATTTSSDTAPSEEVSSRDTPLKKEGQKKAEEFTELSLKSPPPSYYSVSGAVSSSLSIERLKMENAELRLEIQNNNSIFDETLKHEKAYHADQMEMINERIAYLESVILDYEADLTKTKTTLRERDEELAKMKTSAESMRADLQGSIMEREKERDTREKEKEKEKEKEREKEEKEKKTRRLPKALTVRGLLSTSKGNSPTSSAGSSPAVSSPSPHNQHQQRILTQDDDGFIAAAGDNDGDNTMMDDSGGGGVAGVGDDVQFDERLHLAKEWKLVNIERRKIDSERAYVEAARKAVEVDRIKLKRAWAKLNADHAHLEETKSSHHHRTPSYTSSSLASGHPHHQRKPSGYVGGFVPHGAGGGVVSPPSHFVRVAASVSVSESKTEQALSLLRLDLAGTRKELIDWKKDIQAWFTHPSSSNHYDDIDEDEDGGDVSDDDDQTYKHDWWQAQHANWTNKNEKIIANVIFIQSLARRYLASVYVHDRLPTSIVTIQRVYRGHLARKEARTVRHYNRNTSKIVKCQACVRGFLARRVMKKMQRRALIAREILDTERAYVDSLRLIVDVYVHPMNQMQPSVKDYSRSIFSELEVILAYNGMLLKTLEQRMKNWKTNDNLGDAFLKMTDFLKVYTQYVNNFNSALKTITLSKQHERLGPFLEACAKDPRCKGLDLGALLIAPIQRIPRYVLLLEDLVRHTPSSHLDHKNLTSALWKMKAVAEYVNEKKREADNIHEVERVQEKLGSFEAGFDLAVPHRRYIREGIMVDLKTKNKMYLFLFNDLVICTKKITSVFTTATDSYKYVSRHNINENTILQALPAKDPVPRFSFQIESDGQTLALTASSQEEMDSWMADISATIHKIVLGSTRIKGMKSISGLGLASHAAVATTAAAAAAANTGPVSPRGGGGGGGGDNASPSSSSSPSPSSVVSLAQRGGEVQIVPQLGPVKLTTR
eukprot:TRINITY_DN3459_c0_g1_i2.p1 TRINITY_DN3459_c0_g1~~TRINITY_DN3459_c0_g1_i2.p1  ORF type:complete len:1330 (+),score=357.21 TRINITY_DN3459_c0_g1_i2:583-3990(+)